LNSAMQADVAKDDPFPLPPDPLLGAAKATRPWSPLWPFQFRQRVGVMHMRRIVALDLTRIVQEGDVQALQDVMETIMFGHFDEGVMEHWADEHIVKLVKVSQLIMEFLHGLYSHGLMTLQRVNEKAQEAKDRAEKYKRKLAEAQKQLKKRADREREMVMVGTRAPHGCRICAHCGKAYSTAEFLRSHIKRRHPDVPVDVSDDEEPAPVSTVNATTIVSAAPEPKADSQATAKVESQFQDLRALVEGVVEGMQTMQLKMSELKDQPASPPPPSAPAEGEKNFQADLESGVEKVTVRFYDKIQTSHKELLSHMQQKQQQFEDKVLQKLEEATKFSSQSIVGELEDDDGALQPAAEEKFKNPPEQSPELLELKGQMSEILKRLDTFSMSQPKPLPEAPPAVPPPIQTSSRGPSREPSVARADQGTSPLREQPPSAGAKNTLHKLSTAVSTAAAFKNAAAAAMGRPTTPAPVQPSPAQAPAVVAQPSPAPAPAPTTVAPAASPPSPKVLEEPVKVEEPQPKPQPEEQLPPVDEPIPKAPTADLPEPSFEDSSRFNLMELSDVASNDSVFVNVNFPWNKDHNEHQQVKDAFGDDRTARLEFLFDTTYEGFARKTVKSIPAAGAPPVVVPRSEKWQDSLLQLQQANPTRYCASAVNAIPPEHEEPRVEQGAPAPIAMEPSELTAPSAAPLPQPDPSGAPTPPVAQIPSKSTSEGDAPGPGPAQPQMTAEQIVSETFRLGLGALMIRSQAAHGLQSSRAAGPGEAGGLQTSAAPAQHIAVAHPTAGAAASGAAAPGTGLAPLDSHRESHQTSSDGIPRIPDQNASAFNSTFAAVPRVVDGGGEWAEAHGGAGMGSVASTVPRMGSLDRTAVSVDGMEDDVAMASVRGGHVDDHTDIRPMSSIGDTPDGGGAWRESEQPQRWQPPAVGQGFSGPDASLAVEDFD